MQSEFRELESSLVDECFKTFRAFSTRIDGLVSSLSKFQELYENHVAVTAAWRSEVSGTLASLSGRLGSLENNVGMEWSSVEERISNLSFTSDRLQPVAAQHSEELSRLQAMVDRLAEDVAAHSSLHSDEFAKVQEAVSRLVVDVDAHSQHIQTCFEFECMSKEDVNVTSPCVHEPISGLGDLPIPRTSQIYGPTARSSSGCTVSDAVIDRPTQARRLKMQLQADIFAQYDYIRQRLSGSTLLLCKEMPTDELLRVFQITDRAWNKVRNVDKYVLGGIPDLYKTAR